MVRPAAEDSHKCLDFCSYKYSFCLWHLPPQKKNIKTTQVFFLPKQGGETTRVVSTVGTRQVCIYKPWFLGCAFKYFLCSSLFGENDPIWRAYFSKGLVQPPSRFVLIAQIHEPASSKWLFFWSHELKVTTGNPHLDEWGSPLATPWRGHKNNPNKVTWKNLEPHFLGGGSFPDFLTSPVVCWTWCGSTHEPPQHRGVGFVATTDQMKLDSSCLLEDVSGEFSRRSPWN